MTSGWKTSESFPPARFIPEQVSIKWFRNGENGKGCWQNLNGWKRKNKSEICIQQQIGKYSQVTKSPGHNLEVLEVPCSSEPQSIAKHCPPRKQHPPNDSFYEALCGKRHWLARALNQTSLRAAQETTWPVTALFICGGSRTWGEGRFAHGSARDKDGWFQASWDFVGHMFWTAHLPRKSLTHTTHRPAGSSTWGWMSSQPGEGAAGLEATLKALQ